MDKFRAYSDSGREIRVGDAVWDSRMNQTRLVSIDRATELGRDGKVTVEGSKISYYASVFGLFVLDVAYVESGMVDMAEYLGASHE